MHGVGVPIPTPVAPSRPGLRSTNVQRRRRSRSGGAPASAPYPRPPNAPASRSRTRTGSRHCDSCCDRQARGSRLAARRLGRRPSLRLDTPANPASWDSSRARRGGPHPHACRPPHGRVCGQPTCNGVLAVAQAEPQPARRARGRRTRRLHVHAPAPGAGTAIVAAIDRLAAPRSRPAGWGAALRSGSTRRQTRPYRDSSRARRGGPHPHACRPLHGRVCAQPTCNGVLAVAQAEPQPARGARGRRTRRLHVHAPAPGAGTETLAAIDRLAAPGSRPAGWGAALRSGSTRRQTRPCRDASCARRGGPHPHACRPLTAGFAVNQRAAACSQSLGRKPRPGVPRLAAHPREGTDWSLARSVRARPSASA